MIKSRPILFSAPMIRALLEGRKTQTRRTMKTQPYTNCVGTKLHGDEFLQVLLDGDGQKFTLGNVNQRMKCPYGKSGELLWVRETFCEVDDKEYADDGKIWYDYRATPRYAESHPAGWDNDPDHPEALKWKPSIHMPRVASRLTLEITSVRVERLQDISEADALAEGIPEICITEGRFNCVGDKYVMPLCRDKYHGLWNTINGAGAWDANPWVWVLEFAVHQKNVDIVLI